MGLLDLLFPPREDERALRAISIDAFAARACPQEVGAMRPRAVGLALYSDSVVRAAIHEAKYHDSAYAFTLLAALLVDFLPAYLEETRFNLVAATRLNLVSIVPVPLGSARRRERGYNQAEEVARRALPSLTSAGLPATLDTSLLSRIRETKTQVSLPRKEREENMRGAFVARREPDERRLYVLLDDVLTTGATLGACVEALAKAGVSRERLLPLALAYQP